MNNKLQEIRVSNSINDESKVCAIGQDMILVLQKAEATKSGIEAIENATDELVTLSNEALRAITTKKETKIRQEFNTIVTNTNQRAKQTKLSLDQLKEDMEGSSKRKSDENDQQQSDKVTKRKKKFSLLRKKKKRKKPAAETTMNDTRVLQLLYRSLCLKFVDAVRRYQETQEQHKEDIQNKMKRQIQIIKPNVTDEEVDHIIKSKGGRDDFYREMILTGGVTDEVRTTFVMVSEKYQDVIALEQSVAELHELMLSFALITEEQGGLLDNIEFHVGNTVENIKDGNDDLYEAVQDKKKIRKKQFFTILGTVIIVVVVALFSMGSLLIIM